jgi:hypothetical protein
MGQYADKVKLVRLLTGDKAVDDYIFTDDEMESFLELSNGNVYCAAADALDAIAANAAYTLKVLTILDVTTNGQATAEAIRASAAALRAKADADAANTIVCGVANVVTPQLPTHWRPWWEALA